MSRPFALVLLIALAACSEADATVGDRLLRYQNDETTPARFELGGVPVDVLPPRTAELSIVKRSSSLGSAVTLELNVDDAPAAETEFEAGLRVWLAGQRLRVEGGELWIGARSYGDVDGRAVVIDADGVRVDGEAR